MQLETSFETIDKKKTNPTLIWNYASKDSILEYEIWGTSTPFIFELAIRHPDIERVQGGKRLILNGRDRVVPARFSLPADVYNDLNKTLRKYTQRLLKKSNDYGVFTKDEISLSVEEISKLVFGTN